MAISDWPLQERPREKLLQHGAKSLSDAELLAIFIRTGVRGKTAIDLARELLQKCQGLRSLLDTEQQQFCQTPGLGVTKFVQLQAALELGKRYIHSTLQRQNVLSNPVETHRYLIAKLRGYQQEVFACLFLDGQHRVIAFEELFYGTINAAQVHAREVVKRCLAHNAAAVILAHNHPSGSVKPSEHDIELTAQLKLALTLIDVSVLDHMVIGDGESASFLQLGLM